MCLAIYKPRGIEIAKKHLRNGFDNNEDGAGFAVVIDGRLETFKGYMKFGDFWKAYKPYRTSEAIIHFRFATHGMTNEENCHPFLICNGKYAVIHNGVIPIKCNDTNKSDTYHFATLVLEPMFNKNEPTDSALTYLIEETLTNHNKIVVLGADGSHVIYNEKAGHWHKGAWYSNDGYKYRHTYSFADWRDWAGNCGASIVKGGKTTYTYPALSNGSRPIAAVPLSQRNGGSIVTPEDVSKESFPDWCPPEEKRAYAADDADWTENGLLDLTEDEIQTLIETGELSEEDQAEWYKYAG